MSAARYHVSVLWFAICLLTIAAARYVATKRSYHQGPLSTFRVTKVTQDLSRIRLYLEGSTRLVQVFWQNRSDELQPLAVDDDGVVEFHSEENTALTMEFFCVAEGTPAPTVSFLDSNGSILHDDSYAYDIEILPPNGSVSTALLRTHGADVLETLGLYILCRAENDVNGRHFSDTHTMFLGDIPPAVRYYLENYVDGGNYTRIE